MFLLILLNKLRHTPGSGWGPTLSPLQGEAWRSLYTHWPWFLPPISWATLAAWGHWNQWVCLWECFALSWHICCWCLLWVINSWYLLNQASQQCRGWHSPKAAYTDSAVSLIHVWVSRCHSPFAQGKLTPRSLLAHAKPIIQMYLTAAVKVLPTIAHNSCLLGRVYLLLLLACG